MGRHEEALSFGETNDIFNGSCTPVRAGIARNGH